MSDKIKKIKKSQKRKRIEGGDYETPGSNDNLYKEYKKAGLSDPNNPYKLGIKIYKTAFYFDEGEGTESYLINLNEPTYPSSS